MDDWKAALGKAITDLQLVTPRSKGKIQHSRTSGAKAIQGSSVGNVQVSKDEVRSAAVGSQQAVHSKLPSLPGPVTPKTTVRPASVAEGTKHNKDWKTQASSATPAASKHQVIASRKVVSTEKNGEVPVLRRRLSQTEIQRDAKRQVERSFAVPDMSKYSIRHTIAMSAQSQAWQDVGRAIVLNPEENRGRAQCTIGLDFGTAFTKACVQFRGITYVVDWSLAVPGCTPSLLPGVFSSRPDGNCVLGETGSSTRSGLKIALMDNRDYASQVDTVVFLALATRYIRAWLFTTLKTVFSGFRIEWFVNVGLPTVPWEEPQMSALYERIAFAGWNLGTSSGDISIANAKELLSQLDSHEVVKETIDRERVKSFPEFVAQIASYVQSAQRRNDLHLLVDVGAGTVDVVIFHIGNNEEEDDCFLIHKSSIVRNGTHILLGYRAEESGLGQTIWDEEFARLGSRDLEKRSGLAPLSLTPIDDHFSERLFLLMRKLISETKRIRYQTSPVWESGLPFLLCGGGKDIDVYRNAMTQVRSQWSLLEMRLSLPESFVATGVGASEFHRVSVAHGLSFSAENLGQIQPESEVADIRKPQSVGVNFVERYIEK
jgi:hypothetical protein